jgi:hypothetical protein
MCSLRKSFDSFLAVVLITSLIILQPTLVSAQTSSNTSPPAIQWQKVYGNGFTETVSKLIQTSDGGYAFLDCGNVYQEFIPSILYKLDSSGNMQWDKTINVIGSSLIQTSDGGYEITGWWTMPSGGGNTPTLIKTDSKGNIQWNENTSTVLNLATASKNIIKTSDGGFVYFGGTFLRKMNSNNNTQWILNLPYSGPGYSLPNGTITFPFEIFSLIETSDGGLAGLGIADAYQAPQEFWGFIYLVKIAPFLPLPSQSPLLTPWLVIVPLLLSVFSVAVILRHRKTANSKQ